MSKYSGRYALLFLLLTYTAMAFAQKVSNNAFQLTLDAMLSHSVNELSVGQLKQMKPAWLLDTRSPQEFRVSHLSGAYHVGYERFKLDNLPAALDKNDTIVLYCSVGYRSEKIAEQLQEAGYNQVYNLYGGIFEWVNQNGQVVNEAGATVKVHPYSWLWGQWLQKGEKSKE